MATITILSASNIASATTSTVTRTYTYNGITYQIEESYNESGNKVVTVIGNNEVNTVVNNGKTLELTKETSESTTTSEVNLKSSSSSKSDIYSLQYSEGSLYTPFWSYSYYWHDAKAKTSYGMYYYLTSGDSSGSYHGYDHNNDKARSYAESFMGNVNSMMNQQSAAVAAMGFAAASAVAGAITAETGIGAIVGVVLAVGGSIGSAGYWVAAYTDSLSANYNFSQFKNDM